MIFLVSVIVEKPGMMGHRARVVISDDKDKALGSSLQLWQTDGWNVTSFDISEVNNVMPKPIMGEEK